MLYKQHSRNNALVKSPNIWSWGDVPIPLFGDLRLNLCELAKA